MKRKNKKQDKARIVCCSYEEYDDIVTYDYDNKRLEVKRANGSGYGAQGEIAFSMFKKEVEKRKNNKTEGNDK